MKLLFWLVLAMTVALAAAAVAGGAPPQTSDPASPPKTDPANPPKTDSANPPKTDSANPPNESKASPAGVESAKHAYSGASGLQNAVAESNAFSKDFVKAWAQIVGLEQGDSGKTASDAAIRLTNIANGAKTFAVEAPQAFATAILGGASEPAHTQQ